MDAACYLFYCSSIIRIFQNVFFLRQIFKYAVEKGQKDVSAAKTEEENVRLKHRISQLDENAIAREKNKTAAAERKAQEQLTRANREEQQANNAESRLSMMERFVRQTGVSEAFDRWANLTAVIDKAIAAFNAWAHSRASIFNSDDERVIGQGIIAKCQLEGLNPVSETDRKTAASSIAEMAEETIGSISQFMWGSRLRFLLHFFFVLDFV